jgi:DNA-nicking Smr family endonuclease
MTPPRRPRRRELTPEERALWDAVAQSVVPLRPRKLRKTTKADEPVAASEPDKPAAPRKAAGPNPSATPAKPPMRLPLPRPLAELEPKIARTLRRGGDVDARLDLHGMRQDEAHQRLRAFLRTAQARQSKVVLVITGKGGRDTDHALFDERGVLRRQVPLWLAGPDLRNVVIGFSQAAPAHGGAGALYVRIRRLR